MLKKILIANRGEIACRIVRTARRMGIATVAVHTEAERDALHVEMADEARAIASYLAIDEIVAACRDAGADAVHPGYGFLSERADFAEALAAAGIGFIGPNARAIAVMGDKIEAKRLARAAAISMVPGHPDAIEDAARAVEIADTIGYPVLLKAAAGGGGKGIRLAHDAEDVRTGFERARSEAASFFGDGRLFIEKYIDKSRHIEIQILGDRHGNIVHLGERECSIQRRNQKIVEEAPSPFLNEATRKAMAAQAVALAGTVGYDSAGTVEFIVGRDGDFYFLEMNTRLQVEHPVTEKVTGIDLVEQMIRVAAGEKLSFTQDQVRFGGWAIESRIYAEDPTRKFLPSAGRLVTYRPPETSEALRIDSGVREGTEISVHYDPMIAKLITHGPDRASAIAAQADALDGFAIDGIRHNIPFLAALMAHPRWQAGEISTGFIDEAFPGGFATVEPAGNLAWRMAAIAIAIDTALNDRKRLISGQMPAKRPVDFETARVALLGRTEYALDIVGREADGTLVLGNDEGRTIRLESGWRPGLPIWRGAVDGIEIAVRARPILNGMCLWHAGSMVDARVYTRREARLFALMPEKREIAVAKRLLCPMPGLVRMIAVAPGQEVKAGEPLAVIEAMKMENLLRAEHDATIARVLAKEGESLAVDAVILEFA